MYAATALQIGAFFDLAAWTESGGENTFTHSPAQYFSRLRARTARRRASTRSARPRARKPHPRHARTIFRHLHPRPRNRRRGNRRRN